MVLNRDYKPLGMITKERVDYAPWAIKLPGLTIATIAKLSWNGSTDRERIWLYNDGCRPTKSKKAMDSYLERVERLMELAGTI